RNHDYRPTRRSSDLAQRLTFEHLTGSDGLSHAHVESILQDHLGFLWIGTYGGGLNRYDGYGFTVYEHDPNDLTSLANNNVGALRSEEHTSELQSREN